LNRQEKWKLKINEIGSLFLTRPSLGDYVATREEMVERSEEVFKWARDGIMNLSISATLSLKDVAEAHQLLEGSLVLSIPPSLLILFFRNRQKNDWKNRACSLKWIDSLFFLILHFSLSSEEIHICFSLFWQHCCPFPAA
jgi:hypothetical protein